MASIQLLEFQQEAADRLVSSALRYYEEGPDKIGGRPVPFIGQLKAVTGAGKTPVLSTVVGRLGSAIVLWTTKFGSVVDQTVANLRPGGKYHHLFGPGGCEVVRFGDIPSFAEWETLLERENGLTVVVSTVAAWYSSEQDDRLNVHKVGQDWGDRSRWDQLKADRKRPLWVVYDEAHNSTTEQVELLDELAPAGFFVASASPLKGKLRQYLSNLPDDLRKERIVPISTRAVVEAQLLKSTISIADYDSSPEEMISDAAAKRRSIEERLTACGAPTVPKAIFVVEASNTTKGDEPRPTAIWRSLVNACKVPVDKIAVCTNTKELPKDAIRVATIDQLSDSFTHIIFNKKLQEGWDDPAVYVCYFDGKTESATRIQQVLGRALRQPGAEHLHDEDLNTAYFYINCPNEALDKITDQLKEELRIYKGDDEPEDFEPFQIREERKALGRIPTKPGVPELTVPLLQVELPNANTLKLLIAKKTIDFSAKDRSAAGKATVNIVSVKTGEIGHATRDLFEDMRVRCGAYLHGQIRALSRNCANTIHPDVFANTKLDKSACFNSKALDYYRDLAIEVVRSYEARVQLSELADAVEAKYRVGDYQPSGAVTRDFEHAAHPRYDLKAFRADELDVARALDKFESYYWVRNKDRLDYGIPLPVKSGASSTFYPDFLWWVKGTVWAIDPTGRFILEEKVRNKLLMVPPPLRIALMTPERLDSNYKSLTGAGWTLVRFRAGNLSPQIFDDLYDMMQALVEES